MSRRIAVIGCGASGMAAALSAAAHGAHVTVLEKNDRAGKKLFLTGKGRCNVTNDCETTLFFDRVVRGSKFLYSAVYGFDHVRVQHFFTERGCALKTERGGRVFPVSDKSSDIIRTLTRAMEQAGVDVRYGCDVRELTFTEEGGEKKVTGLILQSGERIGADAIIIATGGLSYPATGSTGDGYRFAKAAGHEVTDCVPSLVPFETKEEWCRSLQGLALKNVRLYTEGKRAFDEQGEMLFTHFGVSGPLVLSASALCGEAANLTMYIDLKPALTMEQVRARIDRDLREAGGKHLKNALSALFPARLIPVMIGLSGIDAERKASAVTGAERDDFAALIKRLPFQVTKTRGFAEAVITRGGVALSGIDPHTMASTGCGGLYFAGEVIDADALTGGYNLQIAWSTGHLAGKSAATDAP